jgi:hypothetical protein
MNSLLQAITFVDRAGAERRSNARPFRTVRARIDECVGRGIESEVRAGHDASSL